MAYTVFAYGHDLGWNAWQSPKQPPILKKQNTIETCPKLQKSMGKLNWRMMIQPYTLNLVVVTMRDKTADRKLIKFPYIVKKNSTVEYEDYILY